MKSHFPTMLIAAVAASAGCEPQQSGCEVAYSLVEQQRYQQALPALDACLKDQAIPVLARARYLQGRAWTLHSLGRTSEAIQEQERSFSLASPSYRLEYINYAVMLRSEKRYDESLRAIEGAERIDKSRNETAMMTQYHKGWTLQEAGNHREAVAAFSAAVPAQPEFPFVFWKRAASFEAMGEKEFARDDLRKFVELYTEEWRKHSTSRQKAEYRTKVQEFGLTPSW